MALAPCVVGYAEIAARLAAQPGACDVTNPYRVWIDEYAGAPYQEVAAKARAHLDRLANLYVTPAREAELVTIFKEATRLETDFWEMGWRAGLRVEYPRRRGSSEQKEIEPDGLLDDDARKAVTAV